MRRDSGAGFILVAVLGVTALIAALIGAVSLLVRSAVDGVRAGSDDLAFAGLTRAGIELAGYQLYGLKTPFETLDGQQVRLDSGVVTLFVKDESGRIDLNGADPALLTGLARAAGLSALPPASFAARYRATGPELPIEPGSLDRWLTERYCLYTLDRGQLYRADIHHPPWPLQTAEAAVELNTMPPPGIALPPDEPLLHFAARQDVVIWPLAAIA